MSSPVVTTQVVPKLLLPQEIMNALALVFDQVIDDVSVVDLYGDQGYDHLTQNVWDLLSDDQCQLSQLFDYFLQISLNVRLLDAVLGTRCPNNLGGYCYYL